MTNCANCGGPVTANNGNGYKIEKFPNEVFCSPECLNDYFSKKSVLFSNIKNVAGEIWEKENLKESAKFVVGNLWRETLVGEVVSGAGKVVSDVGDALKEDSIAIKQLIEKQKEKQEKLCNTSFGDDPIKIVDILNNLSLEIRSTYKNESLIGEEDQENLINQYYQKYEQGLQRLQLLSADNNTAMISYEEAKAEFDKIQKEITKEQAKQKKHERREWIVFGILFVVGIVLFSLLK